MVSFLFYVKVADAFAYNFDRKNKNLNRTEILFRVKFYMRPI